MSSNEGDRRSRVFRPIPIRSSVERKWSLLHNEDLCQPLGPVPWVCEGLGLAPGGVTLVAGYGYSRKTMALQSLLLSVAAGRPVWGKYPVKQGSVIHFDYEQGRRVTQDRYQRLARGMGFDLRDLPKDSLRVACMPSIYFDQKDASSHVVDLIGSSVCAGIDSFKAAFPSADENSSEVRRHLDMLVRVSETTKAAMPTIHHSRKPSKEGGNDPTYSIRGSSALFDACQSAFIFEGAKNTPTKVHHQKDRLRGATLDNFGLLSEDVAGPSGPRDGLALRFLLECDMEVLLRRASDVNHEASLQSIETKLVDFMAASHFAFVGSIADIREQIGVSKPALAAVIHRLVEQKRMVREGPLRFPTWRLIV